MVRSSYSIVDVCANALVDFGETPINGPRRLFYFSGSNSTYFLWLA